MIFSDNVLYIRILQQCHIHKTRELRSNLCIRHIIWVPLKNFVHTHFKHHIRPLYSIFNFFHFYFLLLCHFQSPQAQTKISQEPRVKEKDEAQKIAANRLYSVFCFVLLFCFFFSLYLSFVGL